jgi:hypothetical protein
MHPLLVGGDILHHWYWRVIWLLAFRSAQIWLSAPLHDEAKAG